MINYNYTRSIAVCLSLILLSSCVGVRNDIERLFKPKVTENPYRSAKTHTRTTRTQTPQTHSIQDWAPTTRHGTTGVVQAAGHQGANTSPPPRKINIAGSTPPPSGNTSTDPMFAKPKTSPSTVTQVPTPPKPVAVAPPHPEPKPSTVTPPRPAEKIYTVSLVANKPTHVYHPLSPTKIIRITDANGIKYRSGTIMRVPGENIRFYVP